MHRIAWLIAAFMAQNALGASAAAIVTYGDEHCRTIRFREGWQLPAAIRQHTIERFEFRKPTTSSEEYVVAVVAKSEYSVNKFRVDLGGSGEVRPASDAEWDAAIPVTGGERLRLGLPVSRHGDNFVFRQHAFRKSGPRWPVPGDDARISADEKWIAVQSWQGADFRDGDVFFMAGSQLATSHRFFVDLYEVSTGDKIVAFDGVDHAFSAGDAPLMHSFWLESRYFMVPLGSHREKLLACEVPGVSSTELRQRATN